MRKLSFFFFALLLIISCSDRKKIPKDILPKEKMQAVLWSMISAGEFLNAYILIKDSIDKVAESSKIYGQVFQVHHINREEFDKSYSYYRVHPELMKEILDSLSKKQLYTKEPLKSPSDSARKKMLEKTEVQ